jgi:rhodanese-related sulfurtransferase
MRLPEVDVQDATHPLLDVRTDEEWAEAHVAGGVHIPMHELTARLDEMPTTRPLSVICHIGQRSAYVTEWLVEQGVDAQNVRGGMVAWAQAGLPMESG